jgi:O-antigen/teichoic acid export membrane protein
MKSLYLYTISTAINRGSFIIFSPILLNIILLEEFALYNLIFILSMLISPLFTIGGSASILREGVSDVQKAYTLLIYYIIWTILLATIVFLLITIYDKSIYNWITFVVLLSFIESIFLLTMAYIRTINKAMLYLYLSLLKLFIILLTLYISYIHQYNLNDILLLQFILQFILLIFILFFIYSNSKNKIIPIKNSSEILLFGILLVPHGLSQWIMSSSDRLLIELFLNTEILGIYTIGYLIASILMLINSGISLSLPQQMIKNYTKWKEMEYDVFWVKKYSFATIILLILLVIFFIIDNKYLFIIKYYTCEMYLTFSFAYIGITILGFYYFYANYLFYFKKSKVISIQTFLAASINVILTIILINIIGVIGAAIATMISYSVYLYLVRKEALKLDDIIQISNKIDIIFLKLISFQIIILNISYIWIVK